MRPQERNTVTLAAPNEDVERLGETLSHRGSNRASHQSASFRGDWDPEEEVPLTLTKPDTGEPAAYIYVDRSDHTKLAKGRRLEELTKFFHVVTDDGEKIGKLIKTKIIYLLTENNIWLFLTLLSLCAGVSGAFNDISVGYIGRRESFLISSFNLHDTFTLHLTFLNVI